MAVEHILPRYAVDVSDFAGLARKMREAKSTFRPDLLRRLRAVGEIVATDARGRAGQWSESIPPSIKVRIRGLTITVQAGGQGVPLAGLFELGNKKAASEPGMFKAPNFPPKGSQGQGAFVFGGHFQPMHPFLGPAGDAHGVEVEEAAYGALEAVFGGAYLMRR
jgi:hypothetical protein